jgi:GMP synthase PP-ATPase subunit
VKQFGLKFEDVMLAQGTLRPDLIESASKMVRALWLMLASSWQ